MTWKRPAHMYRLRRLLWVMAEDHGHKRITIELVEPAERDRTGFLFRLPDGSEHRVPDSEIVEDGKFSSTQAWA